MATMSDTELLLVSLGSLMRGMAWRKKRIREGGRREGGRERGGGGGD